jgi:hypothetical protein
MKGHMAVVIDMRDPATRKKRRKVAERRGH